MPRLGSAGCQSALRLGSRQQHDHLRLPMPPSALFPSRASSRVLPCKHSPSGPYDQLALHVTQLSPAVVSKLLLQGFKPTSWRWRSRLPSRIPHGGSDAPRICRCGGCAAQASPPAGTTFPDFCCSTPLSLYDTTPEERRAAARMLACLAWRHVRLRILVHAVAL